MQAIINQELSLDYPESFTVLDQEKKKQIYQKDYQNTWVIQNEDQHIMMAVFYHTTHRFLTKIVNIKDVTSSNEKRMRKGLKGHDYHFDGFFSTEVSGHEAHGYRYHYKVQDIEQLGEVIALIHGDCCYTLYYYTRPGYDNHHFFDELIASITFA